VDLAFPFTERRTPGKAPLSYYASQTRTMLDLCNTGQREEAGVVSSTMFEGQYSRAGFDSHQAMLLGLSYGLLGQRDAALENLRRALVEQPRNLYALSLLVDIDGIEPDYLGFAAARIRELERWSGREDLFVFGDSHAEFCFGGIARAKVHWLENTTMHKTGRDGITVLNLFQAGVPDGATVLFCFGEIDVRAHIGRQRDEKGRDVDEIIDVLVTRHVACLRENLAHYRCARVILASVMPPTSKVRPFHGTHADRIAIAGRLNARLAAAAVQEGFAFFDLNRLFRDQDGGLDERFRDGTVHACKKFYYLVEGALERQGLLSI
jgi:hypothetical protein